MHEFFKIVDHLNPIFPLAAFIMLFAAAAFLDRSYQKKQQQKDNYYKNL